MNSRYKALIRTYFFVGSLPIVCGTQLNLLTPLGPVAYSKPLELLFVGSSQVTTGTAAGFAIAVAGAASTVFSGITGPLALINGQEQANPLNGAQINYLSTLGRAGVDSMPIAVTAADPTHVYVVSQYTSPVSTVLISPALPDGTGAITSGIQALSGSGQNVFFAAVAPQGGSFGDPASGIVTGLLTTNTSNQPTITLPQINLIDRTSSLLTSVTALTTLDTPLLYTSYYIDQRQGEDVYVGTLFAGFHAVSGADPSATVRAVVSSASPVGFSLLQLQQIVTTSALGADSIIGGVGASVEVTIHQLATLLPSVGTQYLVVVGGVGVTNEDPVNVYALPLTGGGQLAAVNSLPVPRYDAGQFYSGRQFMTVAQTPDQLYTSTSIPAIVGGGTAPGTITGVYTSGDSVCISVTNNGAGQASGIFYSQAIFNSNTVICGWTPWARAVYPATASSFVIFDNVINGFWYGMGAPGAEQSVVRTNWQQDSTQLAQVVSAQLPPAQGGVQGITDIAYTSSLIFTATPFSFAILTGNSTVCFAQTAQTVNGQLTPQVGCTPAVVCSDGTLNNLTTPTDFITSSGGVLNQLGPIIASSVATADTNWILAGGNGGLAVLAESDGSGISIDSLEAGFVDLSTTLSWQQLGTYRNVRKIVTVGDTVYILTDTLLDRFVLSADVIMGAVPLEATRLATAGSLTGGPYGFFSDIVISGPLAILATSSGLVQTGNSSSVATADGQSAMNWTLVNMPESTGVATRLLPITVTGNSGDLFNPTSSGNLYVLSADPGNDQARIYRYVITYGSGAVTSSTVQLFNDQFVQNFPTFFIDLGSYRNFVYTDGILYATSRSRYLVQDLFAQPLPPGYRTLNHQKSPIVNFFTAPTNAIGAIQRLSGLGAWVIPGDFGLVVHQ